uniref:Uncharacterized protein n=1 Tax=Opuntia streptacantha TaxID=393608 RepID=A0A7C9D8M5_OPUST
MPRLGSNPRVCPTASTHPDYITRLRSEAPVSNPNLLPLPHSIQPQTQKTKTLGNKKWMKKANSPISTVEKVARVHHALPMIITKVVFFPPPNSLISHRSTNRAPKPPKRPLLVAHE